MDVEMFMWFLKQGNVLIYTFGGRRGCFANVASLLCFQE